MKQDFVTSRDNSLLRRARAVRDGKIKDVIFVEGLRLCEEALRSALPIEAVIYSDEIAKKQRAKEFFTQIAPVAGRLAVISEKLLDAISYTKTPQGIILLASRPKTGPSVLTKLDPEPALLVVIHHVNNPVNVGAILRTAEAAGATGAIASAHTSDPFSPKALRGSMGSAFRLPIWAGPSYDEVVAWCRTNEIRTVCADPRGATAYTALDWTQSCALILGPEAAGLSQQELGAASQSVIIPMRGGVESLNVAVTAGVLLYEAARQRRG